MTDILELKRQRALLDIMIRQAENSDQMKGQQEAFRLFDGLPRNTRITMMHIRKAGQDAGLSFSPKRWKMLLKSWAGINNVTIQDCKREHNRAIYLL